MRAVMVTAYGGTDVLELVEIASPAPGPGQLLVDVTVAGVNFRDCYERQGAGYGGTPPFVTGAEGAGVVARGRRGRLRRPRRRSRRLVARGGQLRRAGARRGCERRAAADRRQRRDRGGRPAAGHDRALPLARRVPGAARRHGPRARGRRRRRPAADADGARAGRARDRDRLDRREGGPRSRRGCRRDHPLRGLPRARARADGRRRRRGGLRRRRQGHVRREPREPPGARHPRALRRLERRRRLPSTPAA